jgi:hypothetical protein
VKEPLTMRETVAGAVFLAVFLGAVVAILEGCHAQYTAADEAGDKAAESLLSRIYALDAGDEDYPARVRAYSRPGLCAVQQNLFRHDAGRLVGPVTCTEKRE